MAEIAEDETILGMYAVYADLYTAEDEYLGSVLSFDEELSFIIDLTGKE